VYEAQEEHRAEVVSITDSLVSETVVNLRTRKNSLLFLKELK